MSAPTSDISIRAYRAADFEGVIEIWHNGQRSTGIPSPATPEHLRERWTQQRSAGRAAYVAEDGTTIAGFVTFNGEELKQLYVAPTCQGRGVGKKLLDFAKAQMPAGFHLNTALGSRAMKFYEREGLIRGGTGTHPRYGHPTVRYVWTP